MTATAWQADPYTDALRTGRGPLFLRRRDGWLLPLEVERWCEGPDFADRTVLGRCHGPVLDIGCGPGRLVVALEARGRRVLGIDVSPEAVARTVRAGGTALLRSVFEPVPEEGRWETALLIDGNVGIGGDPAALMRRAAEVTAPGAVLIAETSAEDEDADERLEVTVVNGRGERGAPFPWARLGARALREHAAGAGWTAARQWTTAGRSFVELRGPAQRRGT